jgi:hypothetical protein
VYASKPASWKLNNKKVSIPNTEQKYGMVMIPRAPAKLNRLFAIVCG